MVEHRERDPNPPQNPPNGVVNRDVRRKALGVYLGPIVLFFLIVGAALLYWATRPSQPVSETDRTDRDVPRAEGTAGNTTPGGFEPQPKPSSTRGEIEQRTGQTVTELGDLLDEKAHGELGRRVQVSDVDVERVDGPTSFWVKDGSARVEVIGPDTGVEVRAGQQVNIAGVAEKSGNTIRIRASKVSVNPR